MTPRYCCYLGINLSVGMPSVRCMLGLLSGQQICWMGLRFQTLRGGGRPSFSVFQQILSVVGSSPIIMVIFLEWPFKLQPFQCTKPNHLWVTLHIATPSTWTFSRISQLWPHKTWSSPWFQMSKLFRSTYEKGKHLFGWGKKRFRAFQFVLWRGEGSCCATAVGRQGALMTLSHFLVPYTYFPELPSNDW